MATVNPFLSEVNVLEAAMDRSPDFKAPTDSAVLEAQAAVQMVDPTLALNLKSSNIDLPTEKAADETSPILAGMEKFFDSIRGVFGGNKTTTNLNSNTVTNNSSNVTNSSQVVNSQNLGNTESTSNRRSAKSVINSILSTTKSLLLEPVKNLSTSLGFNRENNLTRVEGGNSVLDRVAGEKDSIVNNLTKSENLVTEKAVLEKEMMPSSMISQMNQLAEGSTFLNEQNLLGDLALTSNSNSTTNLTQTGTEPTVKQETLPADQGEPIRLNSTRLVDSKTVNTMLAPDRTVEKTVKQLSKDLPAAVNNLSSSVTSLGGQQSTVTNNVSNAGPTFDQSTNINNSMQRQTIDQGMVQPDKVGVTEPGLTSNQIYLQAIYSALMSGKVRVKLEHS